jgi:uracil-DNA glycosylase
MQSALNKQEQAHIEPTSSVKLDPEWLTHIGAEFNKPYMVALRLFLNQQKELGRVVYPRSEDMFNALNTTPFSKVKVVILGQDPYHGPQQAHGLSFSVRKGIPKPPSLLNIYKEIERDLRIQMPDHGELTGWAEQGVLLLNATLSVEMGQAGSHQGQGWEIFTDEVIKALNEQKTGVVFMLWGAYAQKKGAFIDRNKHFVLTSAHPSPLSAHRGFLGNCHFSETNNYLEKNGQQPIIWNQL